MPRTRISCPNCRQPVTAEVDQLIDVGANPAEKQRFLSGQVNFIQCPNCGYQGNLASPLVYHDPDKELLLTFVPPELGLPRDEQERLLGGLINQAVNRLPQEKRKGYLLRPQANLTMQGLMERVLEADGITREMIQAQQQRLGLIQRLLDAKGQARLELAQQEDAMVDQDFFMLLRRLVEAAMMAGDQESARQLADVQDSILPVTTFGRELQSRSNEMETAMSELQTLGRDLTREKLLDLILNAPNDTRRQAYVSLARPVMDYSFFQLLSEKVDQAQGEERDRLSKLREQLLGLTQKIDQQIEARVQDARGLLNHILQAEDVTRTFVENIQGVDEFFLQELNTTMESARQKGDLAMIGKLQKIVEVIQQMSQQSPEVAFMEEYLEMEDDESRRKFLEAHQDDVSPEFIDALANVAAQMDENQDKEFGDRVRAAHRFALRFSMEKNLKQ